MQPCGTNAAYQRHERASEDPCEACVEARRAHVEVYHEARRRLRDAHLSEFRALAFELAWTPRRYSRALIALTKAHPTEYRALINQVRWQ